MPTPFQFPADFAQSPTADPGTAVQDGVIYRYRFWPSARANDGAGAWYVDLFDVFGVPSLRAIKLILTDDLFGDFRTTGAVLPPGRVVIRRTDGVDADPRPTRKGEIGTSVATLGSPLLVVEYVSISEDAT
jgi:hypothetical protein